MVITSGALMISKSFGCAFSSLKDARISSALPIRIISAWSPSNFFARIAPLILATGAKSPPEISIPTLINMGY